MINIMKAGLVGLALYSQGALGTGGSQDPSQDLQQRSWNAYKKSCPTAITASEEFEGWKKMHPNTPQDCNKIRSLSDRKKCSKDNSDFSTKQDEVETLQITCLNDMNYYTDLLNDFPDKLAEIPEAIQKKADIIKET